MLFYICPIVAYASAFFPQFFLAYHNIYPTQTQHTFCHIAEDVAVATGHLNCCRLLFELKKTNAKLPKYLCDYERASWPSGQHTVQGSIQCTFRGWAKSWSPVQMLSISLSIALQLLSKFSEMLWAFQRGLTDTKVSCSFKTNAVKTVFAWK